MAVCSSTRGVTPAAWALALSDCVWGERARASHSIWTAVTMALFWVAVAISMWNRRSASSDITTSRLFSACISAISSCNSSSCSSEISTAASAQVSPSMARRASSSSNGPTSISPAWPPRGRRAVT